MKSSPRSIAAFLYFVSCSPILSLRVFPLFRGPCGAMVVEQQLTNVYVGWHLDSGMISQFVELPEAISTEIQIPQAHRALCGH